MDPGTDRFALGRLVLDYVRTFTWPVLLLLAVVFYKEDVLTILREREVNIFGVQIGPRVQEIKQQTQAELQDIRALVTELQAVASPDGAGADAPPDPAGSPQPAVPPRSEVKALAEDIETKIVTLQSNLDREIEQIQQISGIQRQMPARPPEAQTAPEAAQPLQNVAKRLDAAGWERRGFAALLDRDFDGAARAFEKARELWPDYHNVSEIAALLQDWRRRGLDRADSPAWPKLYRIIVAKYSWGMPSELRQAFRREATQARK